MFRVLILKYAQGVTLPASQKIMKPVLAGKNGDRPNVINKSQGNSVFTRRLSSDALANVTPSKLFVRQSKKSHTPNNKITVVGLGDVGTATAFTLLATDVTNEVSMIDVDDDKLKGELLDLQYGSSFLNMARVSASKDYSIGSNSKVCVVTAGTEQGRDESREDYISRQAGIVRAIAPELVKYSPDAILLIASEPVDVLTYIAWKTSQLAKNRVLGTGTNLDSARLRFLLSDKLQICPSSCQAFVIGEHGESSVPVWSGATVAGVRLMELNPLIGSEKDPEKFNELHQEVAKSDNMVRQLKGTSSWAMALSIANICDAIINDTNSIHAVSTYAKGEHSIREDIYFSLPCVLGQSGVSDIVRQPLSELEACLLRKSAEVVAHYQDTIKGVKVMQ